MFKRNKYNYAFRLRCVEAVIIGKESIGSVSRKEGIRSTNLRLWLSFYEAYGALGLRERVQRNYEPSFKLDVLTTIERECLSLRSACVRFNIPSESIIINWQKKYRSKGSLGLILSKKGRPPKMKKPIKRKPKKSSKPLTKEEELLLENEYLKAENELLKKLQALVQNNKKQKP